MTWPSQSLDSLGNIQNFTVFSLWKNMKTCEIRAAWPPSLAGPGLCRLPAQNHLLGAPNLTPPQFIFSPGEMFSIINYVVPAFPEPCPREGDPELVFRPGVTVGRSTRFPRKKGGKVFPRTVWNGAERARLLWLKRKRSGWSGAVTIQGAETVPNRVQTF